MLKKFPTFLLALTALSLASGTAVAGKLYKWVDENGKVHYTDTPPPEASKTERQVLNEQGMVTETLARAKTPEEIAAEKEKEKELERQRKLEEEQAAKDRMLLATYTTAEELEMARDGRIQALDAQINVVSGSINTLEKRLSELDQQATQFRNGNKPVPERIQTQIDETRAELLDNQKFLIETRQKQDDIRTKFGQDIERFKKLKGL